MREMTAMLLWQMPASSRRRMTNNLDRLWHSKRLRRRCIAQSETQRKGCCRVVVRAMGHSRFWQSGRIRRSQSVEPMRRLIRALRGVVPIRLAMLIEHDATIDELGLILMQLNVH